MATPPKIFIDGTEITGLATDLAPVLGGLVVTWGSDSDAEQAGPSTLSFDVLVKKSLDDIQLLRHGANIAVTSGSQHVFAGRIRRIAAAPEGEKLRLRVTAADYLSEAESVFVSTNLPEATAAARHTAMWGILQGKGWYPATGGTGSSSTDGQRAQQTYSSIKMLTLLDRYIAADKARYFDASQNSTGTLNRKLSFVKPLLDLDPALLATLDAGWTTDINYPAGYYPAPLKASNVLQDVEWSIDADSVTTVVGLSTPTQDAGSTESSMVDHDYSLGAADVLAYGNKRTTVETDLKYGGATSTAWNATLDRVKANYLTTDSWWQPSDMEVRNFEDVVEGSRSILLSNASRHAALVRITDPAEIVPTDYYLQALALGGEIIWTGTEWKIKLTLGKPVKNRKAGSAEYTYADLQAHTNPDIKNGTYNTITDRLSYQDFQYIKK